MYSSRSRSHSGVTTDKGKKHNIENVGQLEKLESNIGKVGQSQNVESESSSKIHKIILKCRHPYSSFGHIDFKVESGFCINGWNYNLDSDLHGNHIVSRHNPKNNFVLIHKKYEITLKQWLEKKENKDNWCQIYKGWNVNRPKEEARQIIQGILRAVYELHSNDSFHGFLYHPENFAIQYDESVIGGDCKKIKRIFLIHENQELNDRFGIPTDNEIQLGKKNDKLAVSNLIFQQILGGESRYPQDLRKLCVLLEQDNVSSHDWKLIVNHPSLWHWKSRFSYIERVWMQFLHVKQDTQQDMKVEFTKINVQGWEQKIPSNAPPFHRVFNFNNATYRSTPDELLRYLRNVHVHYGDKLHGKAQYYDEQFIEQKTTEVSELFLVDLYNMMCKLNIEI